MAAAHRFDGPGPLQALGRDGAVVVPGALGGAGQHPAVEHPGGQVGHPPVGAGRDQPGGGLIEQGVAPGHQHAVEVAPLQEGGGGGHRVGAHRDGVDHLLAPHVGQGPVGSLQRLVQVVVGVMHVDDADPVGAQPLEARLHRAPGRVVAEVEDGLHRPVRPRLQPPPGLGGDHHPAVARRRARLVAPANRRGRVRAGAVGGRSRRAQAGGTSGRSPQAGAEAALGLAQSVEGGGVEEADAALVGPANRGHRRRLVVAPEDRGQRGRPQRQAAHLQPGSGQLRSLQPIDH